MCELTYGRLDEVLRSLGFSVRMTADPKAKVYEHEEMGALVALPIFPDGDKVLPRHLLAVRAVLGAYGITDPTLVDAGYDICTARKLFGRADVSTTMIYTHVLNQGRPGCAESPRPPERRSRIMTQFERWLARNSLAISNGRWIELAAWNGC